MAVQAMRGRALNLQAAIQGRDAAATQPTIRVHLASQASLSSQKPIMGHDDVMLTAS